MKDDARSTRHPTARGRRPRHLLLLGALALVACGTDAAEPPTARPAADSADTPPAAAERSGTVLFLGTSLTAGYQLPEEQAFPALIQEKIDSAGMDYRVINAGVSGETSAGALRRLSWLVRQPFDVLVLETGSNDMLRGANLDSLQANLQAIIDQVRSARPGAEIVLVGMMAPPNLGRQYAERFQQIYPELARRNDLPLVPFLLQGVGGERELNLADGIHPNAAGHERVAANVWPVLERVLQERGRAASARAAGRGDG